MMMFRKVPATPDLFDAIRNDVFTAMEDFCGEVAADIKDKISVPVGYAVGPRGGTYIIRSKRGESPRTESGALLQSVASSVESDADVITGEISSDKFYAPILEDPNQLDRPTWADTVDEHADDFFDRMTCAVEGK